MTLTLKSKLRKTVIRTNKFNMAGGNLVLLEGINSVLYKAELFLVVFFVLNLPINGQSECLVSDLYLCVGPEICVWFRN